MFLITPELVARLEYADACHSMSYAIHMPQFIGNIESGVLEIPGGYASFAGHGMPTSRVVGLGMAGEVTEALLDKIEAFYAVYDAVPSIDYCPYADLSLMKHLARRGYVPFKQYQIYARSLPADDFTPQDASVSISGNAEAQLWIRTVSQGFLGQDDIPPNNFNPIFASIAYHREDTYCVLARQDGEPAGGGALSIQKDGVAMLFSASTRVGFRGQGVQSQLMKARLDIAEQHGCSVAMILVTPGTTSERNIQRAGFQVAFTKLVFTKGSVA